MSLTKRILVIEDEPASQLVIRQTLSSHYQIDVAGNLARAAVLLRSEKPDLILLDFYLPDGDAFDFMNELQENPATSEIPIILLTQETAVQIKVRSFSKGVYDFITKPFEPAELLARITSHLARRPEVQRTQRVGDLELDTQAQKISLKEGTQFLPLKLSPIEFKILQFLMNHNGKVRTREQLALSVWKRKYFQSRTIDRHISSIRKKLGPCADYLQTVNQGGYLLMETL